MNDKVPTRHFIVKMVLVSVSTEKQRSQCSLNKPPGSPFRRWCVCQHAFLIRQTCWHKKVFRSLFREDYVDQIWWIFGKLPNGLWPPPSPYFWKTMLRFFREIGARCAFPLPKKAQHNFRIRNDPPPFGSFPKIHQIWYRYSSLSLTHFLFSPKKSSHSPLSPDAPQQNVCSGPSTPLPVIDGLIKFTHGEV